MSIIVRAYRTELDPNDTQRSFFYRCAGVARFIYNYGLAEWQMQYRNGQKPNGYKLRKEFNAIKREQCAFVTEVPYAVTEKAFRNLNSAFERYFQEKKDGTVARRIAKLKAAGKWAIRVARGLRRGRTGYELDPGYPQFKSRWGAKKSFGLRNIRVERDRVRLTGIGWVRLKERGYLPTSASGAKFTTYATISEGAGRWYISVQVKEARPDLPAATGEPIGIDLGLKSLAVCSDGRVFENPHALKKEERKLKRLQRELARRKRGSQNRAKTQRKIQRCHARISHVKGHALHTVSHGVTSARPRAVVLEDLNVSGMMKNHHLAKAIADVSFYELRRQVEYKTDREGIEFILADRWFPSSKTCSRCGWRNGDLSLEDRIFECWECGLVIDRDLNAAINLAAIANEGSSGPGLPVELECSEALP